jgi:hypothetical protein
VEAVGRAVRDTSVWDESRSIGSDRGRADDVLRVVAEFSKWAGLTEPRCNSCIWGSSNPPVT